MSQFVMVIFTFPKCLLRLMYGALAPSRPMSNDYVCRNKAFQAQPSRIVKLSTQWYDRSLVRSQIAIGLFFPSPTRATDATGFFPFLIKTYLPMSDGLTGG